MIILYSSPTKHYLDEYSPSVRTKVGTGTCTQDSITHDYCTFTRPESSSHPFSN